MARKSKPWRIQVIGGEDGPLGFTSEAATYRKAQELVAEGRKFTIFHWDGSQWERYEDSTSLT